MHSESFTNQSFQLWVSNKLIFVHAVLYEEKKANFMQVSMAGLTKASLCVQALWQEHPTLRSSFSVNDQLQWSEKENHKLVYIVVFLRILKYRFIHWSALNKGSSLVVCPCLTQGILYIFLYLQSHFVWIFMSFVLRRKWNSFAFPWVSQEIPRNSYPSFNGVFMCLDHIKL